LESKAEMMNLINNGRINRLRKGGIPKEISGNKDFAFGLGSYDSKSAVGHSSMNSIITHTDNLKLDLAKKIHQKTRYEKVMKGYKLDKNMVHHTKASEMRSRSVLANKALLDIDRNLDLIKMNKGHINDASFLEIEKEKARLARVF
jgi:hypothetical protein